MSAKILTKEPPVLEYVIFNLSYQDKAALATDKYSVNADFKSKLFRIKLNGEQMHETVRLFIIIF